MADLPPVIGRFDRNPVVILVTGRTAVARVGGWTAHVLEQIEEDRLIRPRVVYAGEDGRRWVPAERRA